MAEDSELQLASPEMKDIPENVKSLFLDARRAKAERLLLRVEHGKEISDEDVRFLAATVGTESKQPSINKNGSFRKPTVRFTDVRKLIYLDNLAITGVQQTSAQRAGVSAESLRHHRKNDPQFHEAETGVLMVFAESLEVEAHRRAVEGVDRPIYQRGELVGTEKVYSDQLLAMLLKANKPDKYRENQKVEIEHKGGVLLIPASPEDSRTWQEKYGGDAALGSPSMDAEKVIDAEVVEG